LRSWCNFKSQIRNSKFEIKIEIPFARHCDERRPRRDGEIEETGARMNLNMKQNWLQNQPPII
jgi:hypothetical protein